ncbi:MAG: hypothetical protein QNJ16_15785 [Rhodobacter sp.]|nr:hypothetical protein [Rhodobacter sp.]
MAALTGTGAGMDPRLAGRSGARIAKDLIPTEDEENPVPVGPVPVVRSNTHHMKVQADPIAQNRPVLAPARGFP